jgi:hypothetical protein
VGPRIGFEGVQKRKNIFLLSGSETRYLGPSKLQPSCYIGWAIKAPRWQGVAKYPKNEPWDFFARWMVPDTLIPEFHSAKQPFHVVRAAFLSWVNGMYKSSVSGEKDLISNFHSLRSSHNITNRCHMLSDILHFVTVDIFDNWHFSGYFGHAYLVIRRTCDVNLYFPLNQNICTVSSLPVRVIINFVLKVTVS